MSHVEYFKLQAKNLFKDFKDKTQKHFLPDDAEFIVIEYGYREDDFSLMKAQHIIAQMVGFDKWPDLINAPRIELEIAKLLFSNRDTINIQEWFEYIWGIEQGDTVLFPEDKLEMLKQIWLGLPPEKGSFDFRPIETLPANQNSKHVASSEKKKQTLKPDTQITSLPLSKADRTEFIEAANKVFESILQRIGPRNPELTRRLWNADDYVDNMLTEDMLPISRSYALSLIDAFLVHHVLDLITQADKVVRL